MKSLTRIIYESSILLGVTPAEVFGDGRHPQVVMARIVIIYALRYHRKPRPSFPQLAELGFERTRPDTMAYLGKVYKERRASSIDPVN